MIEKPIYSVDSGPSVAPVAGRAYAKADANAPDAIVYDTGGTSFDVTLIRAGEIPLTRDRWLGPEFTGHLLGIAAVAVHSIGAGGGSVAWMDDGDCLGWARTVPGPIPDRLLRQGWHATNGHRCRARVRVSRRRVLLGGRLRLRRGCQGCNWERSRRSTRTQRGGRRKGHPRCGR